MSKLTIALAIGATLAISACARQAPAPEPMAAPVMVEPTSTKGWN
ncbi:MAG: hypothetical protein ACXIUW_08890 [Roseinatronobacter sp.]